MEGVSIAAKGIASLAEKFGVGRLVDRWYDPKHAKRMNQVECENRIREARTDLEVARIRKEAREIDLQTNADSVIEQAAQIMPANATPDEIDRDWANDVLEKIRIVDDEEMQRLWARLIVGEATEPGTFPKRAVDEVARLSKEEANAFTELAGFVWCIRYGGGETEPVLVVDQSNPLCSPSGVLMQTALIDYFSLGVRRFSNHRGELVDFRYYGRCCLLKIKNKSGVQFGDGHLELSRIGKSLFPMCGGKPISSEFERLVERWSQGSDFDVVSS